MPELPEVETVVRDLRPLIVGRTIRSLKVGRRNLRLPWQKVWTAKVIGQRLESLNRRGKWIVAPLHGGPALLLHLGMTGQLTVHSSTAKPADHVHLTLRFENGQELRFRDVRRFGSAALFDDHGELQAYLDARLGPEPFAIDAAYFQSKMQATNRPLKAALLDQAILAGVGNIYADEACFRSHLHPGRRGDSLKPAEADALRIAIEEVLTLAVEGRGSTIRDYIGGSGLKGNYQASFAVYGRTGQPCVTCGTPIQRERIGGRSSHFCPRCQTIPPSRSK